MTSPTSNSERMRIISGPYFDLSGSSRLSYSNTTASCGRVVRVSVKHVSDFPECLYPIALKYVSYVNAEQTVY